jgi:predicted ribosome quality control (RQC) complex YloA/Tae2 family protein
MEISLDIRKTVEENASAYFEAGKKLKRKAEGAEKAISKTRGLLAGLIEKEEAVRMDEDLPVREKKWFEKFRWFLSSEGFLCIGGRDATSNEIVVKKHTEQHDIVFHTEMAGSPFFVIKTEGKKPGKETLEETAIATASFSRAWKLGFPVVETFYVTPSQLTKTPKPGEFLVKGAFIVTGKTTKITAELGLAIGITTENRIMCGPESAVKKHCSTAIKLQRGSEKPSGVAKKIVGKLKLSKDYVDEVVRALPGGMVKI